MSTATFTSGVACEAGLVSTYRLGRGPHVRPLKILTVGADVLAMVVAGTLAFVFRSTLPGDQDIRSVHEPRHILIIVLTLIATVGWFTHYRLYSGRQVSGRLEEFRRLVHAHMAVALSSAAVAFSLRWQVPRGWLLLNFLLGLSFTLGEREAVRRFFQYQRARGRLLRPVLVVGANAEGVAIAADLTSDPGLGYRVVGFTDDDHPRGFEVICDREVRVWDTVDKTLAAVERTGATGVVIATTSLDLSTTNRVVRQLMNAGVHVELSSSLQDIAAERVAVRPLGRHPVAYVEPVRRGGWRHVAKRGFDIVAACGGLFLTTPLLIATAIAIKLDSSGPVLFKQERLGLGDRRFRVYKFRTMVKNAEDLIIDLRENNQADGPLFKMKDDPRVTRLGRILRKLCIDELPQLWNVVKGEMSLVGPRPALEAEMAGWTPELKENRSRVKPGVTGMWQVSPQRHLSFDRYVRLDLYYVDNWSLCTDLAIIVKTVGSVFLRQGEG